MGGVQGMLPMESPSFWTWKPGTLTVEDGRMKVIGWKLLRSRKIGKMKLCTCCLRLGPGAVSHSHSVFLPEKQCHVAPCPLQIHWSLYFKILPGTVLFRQWFWFPLLTSPLGPITILQSPVQFHENWGVYLKGKIPTEPMWIWIFSVRPGSLYFSTITRLSLSTLKFEQH